MATPPPRKKLRRNNENSSNAVNNTVDSEPSKSPSLVQQFQSNRPSNAEYIDTNRSRSESALIKERYSLLEADLSSKTSLHTCTSFSFNVENIALYTTPTSTGLLETLKKANEIVHDVRSVEEALSDFSLVNKIFDGAIRQIKSSSKSFGQYAINDVIQGLLSVLNPPSDNSRTNTPTQYQQLQTNRKPLPWTYLSTSSSFKRLSKSISGCIRSTPHSHDFLLGTLTTSIPQTKARRNRTQKIALSQEHKVGNLQERSNESGRESTSRLTNTTKVLLSHTRQSAGSGVNLWEFVTNPTSLTQTIENLFDLSFLCHDNVAQIFRKNNNPTVVFSSAKDRDKIAKSGSKYGSNQFVLSIDEPLFHKIQQHYSLDSNEPLLQSRQPPDFIKNRMKISIADSSDDDSDPDSFNLENSLIERVNTKVDNVLKELETTRTTGLELEKELDSEEMTL